MPDSYKIAIVGASSLRGKELNESLAESSFASSDFVLMDDEEQIGQLEAVGDEVTFVQRIEPASFRNADFVFFAGSEEATRKYWKVAQKTGASIVDLTGAIESDPGVLLRAPWLQEEGANSAEMPGLTTPAVVSAHPAAVALALLMQRLEQVSRVRSASATVLEPASEYGRAAMDELHQQTVNLLNFQTLPKAVYDTQVAFNATPVFGEAGKFQLSVSEARIRRHYGAIRAGEPVLPLQLVNAPVFHGYGMSLAVEFDQPVALEDVEAALNGEHVEVVPGDADAPTNLSSAGQDDVLVRVRTGDGTEGQTQQFWIWAALDNLKFASLNAVACAVELQRLRPKGKVQ
jgi:aspartate-semialdehyde dehydrogenase